MNSNTLNLDALYNVTPIPIAWQGKEYALARPETLGPLEFSKMQKLMERSQPLARMDEAPSAKQAAELEAVTSELLALLCPGLKGIAMPYTARMGALTHYLKQIAPEDAAEISKGPSKHKGKTKPKGK